MSESPFVLERELRVEQILRLEFEYARETANQAQNDRTTIFNLYLIIVGGVGSILLAVASFTGNGRFTISEEAMGATFALIAVLGFLTLFKLIRLRQAWFSSATAMNVIKNFYLKQFPELKDAFYWRLDTIPARDKAWTITFILCAMVVLIDSIALGAGVYLWLDSSGALAAALAVALAVLGFFLQAAFYFYQLGRADSPPKNVLPRMGERGSE